MAQARFRRHNPFESQVYLVADGRKVWTSLIFRHNPFESQVYLVPSPPQAAPEAILKGKFANPAPFWPIFAPFLILSL